MFKFAINSFNSKLVVFLYNYKQHKKNRSLSDKNSKNSDSSDNSDECDKKHSVKTKLDRKEFHYSILENLKGI